ncbi:MAG: hypothetical protein ACR2PM_09740 [Hyphomicrobiales bacterium]
MVPADQSKSPINGGFHHGMRSDIWIGLAIIAGVAAIAAAAALLATASARFEIGPQLDPVAWFLLALCAVVLLVTFLLTHIQDDFRAGLYLLVFWAVAIVSMLSMLQYFG